MHKRIQLVQRRSVLQLLNGVRNSHTWTSPHDQYMNNIRILAKTYCSYSKLFQILTTRLQKKCFRTSTRLWCTNNLLTCLRVVSFKLTEENLEHWAIQVNKNKNYFIGLFVNKILVESLLCAVQLVAALLCCLLYGAFYYKSTTNRSKWIVGRKQRDCVSGFGQLYGRPRDTADLWSTQRRRQLTAVTHCWPVPLFAPVCPRRYCQ